MERCTVLETSVHGHLPQFFQYSDEAFHPGRGITWRTAAVPTARKQIGEKDRGQGSSMPLNGTPPPWSSFFPSDQPPPPKDLTTSQRCHQLGTKLSPQELLGAIPGLIYNSCHQIYINDIEPVTNNTKLGIHLGKS